MTTKKALACLSILALLSIPAAAQQHEKSKSKHTSWNISQTTNSDSFECSEALRVRGKDGDAVQYGEETQSFANVPLKLVAARNGGISVRQAAGSQIEVKLCKAAVAASDAEALNLLNQVHLEAQGGTVTATGPDRNRDDDGRWTALLLVRAPAGATLDLSAANGGISLKQFRGNVTARTTNGGISLREVSGSIDATTTNGGISLRDSSGNVKVKATNGGLSLGLGTGWQGGSLTAETGNGGVVLEVASGFQTPTEVAVRGMGSVQCSSAVCDGAMQSESGRQRVLRLGGGTPVVKASTVNGGVVIRDPGSARRSRM
jgi:hypothetical protein